MTPLMPDPSFPCSCPPWSTPLRPSVTLRLAGVLERATAGMQALDAKVKSVVINDIDHEAVFGALKAKVPGAVVAAGEIALCHVAHLICSCMATKKFTVEDWADVIGQLSNLIPAEGPIQKVSFRWVMFRG